MSASAATSSRSTRRIALAAIQRVVEDDAYSNRVVASALAGSRLDARDRAFVADLVYGTLRRLRSLDWAIEQRASRPISRMSSGARDVIRLGAYQLLAGIPAHAAVGETVALCGARERAFANAVLRSLAKDPPVWPSGDDERSVSVRTGMQPWACRELARVLPADEVEPAARAFAGRGSLSLRVNRCATTTDALADALTEAGHAPRHAMVSPECLLVDGGDPTTFPGWRDGWFAVQDQASAFVVSALDPQPGDRVLDVCAAPGGKTCDIACRVGAGGSVVASDRRLRRAALVRGAADRLGVRALVAVQDARALAVSGSFDRILVDAPCSGIGAARRRPELLWRPERNELSTLARLQVAITSNAADRLASGGTLVYSVCTFPRAETDAAVDAIQRHRPDLQPVQIDGPDGPSTRIRLWPHRHGCDGMFVATFTKGG